MIAGFRKLLKVHNIQSENFLEVSKEQSKDGHSKENEKQEKDKASENAVAESNDYDSDHYSEKDVNGHVGNINTLVDEADIDNKYDSLLVCV